MKIKNIFSTITPKNKVVTHHISDGSELIPAEIPGDICKEINRCLNKSLVFGYTIDHGRIVNNYGLEPDMYLANFPSAEQQKRYILLGAGAGLLVTVVLLTAFVIS